MHELLNKTQKSFQGILEFHISIREVVFLLTAILCLTPFVSPSTALLIGILIAQFIGHPYLHLNHKTTHILLQVSVVGLGFGMNATSAISAGKDGILFTLVSIIGTLLIGLLLQKILKVEKKTSWLISVGTAICGGSAIAAVSPIIQTEEKQISIALGTVFILNSAALFVFPAVGHLLGMSQTQFGLWSAIAIHDTSSVVGATANYGDQALAIATTVKLARALWIIPVTLISAVLHRTSNAKVKIPYFIGLFVLAMLANTYIPGVSQYSQYVVNAAKAGLTLTLFLIGSGLSFGRLKSVGVQPMIQGLILWVSISLAALWVVLRFV